MKIILSLISAGQMKMLANASKNFVLMMIKFKETNDDISKAFEGRDLNHKFEMVKIISEYDEVFQELVGLPPKKRIQHEI